MTEVRGSKGEKKELERKKKVRVRLEGRRIGREEEGRKAGKEERREDRNALRQAGTELRKVR